ncbi:efflux transporter outer membrane subunit [Methylobacillus flagellatus]|uniref:efflux transporter outer membrane subunit n=1 Tax=Methylobacillus flagellatus TaxID=405 RepID=UPI0010F51C2D|nr:efflux transporter outer membrane subunit [Methylobacillus flagellatus]
MSPGFVIKKSTLLISLALLASCAMVGPDYQRPASELPANYTAPQQASDGAVLSPTWWTLYQDPQLNQLVEQALARNTDIRIALARVEEADAAMREVGAALFPAVNLTGGGTRSRVTEAGAFPVFSSNPRENYVISAGTSFELDFWGKLRRGKEAAKAQALSTRYARDTLRISLASMVASNYLQLRSLDTQIKLSQDSLRSREDSLGLTQRRQDGGVASALDVHQAQVAVSNLRAQIAEQSRLRSTIQNQLAVLTGVLDLQLADADLDSLPVPPVPPAGLPSSLLEARPDVRQAEQNLVAANANIGVAKAALYPSVSLTASFGGESIELGDVLKSAARVWSTGLSFSLPIFNAGRLDARVDQAAARQKQMLVTYEQALNNAFREVNDALVTTRQTGEREAALKVSADAAGKALQIAEQRYKAGYSAYLEVLDAQRVHNDATLAYTQARQTRLVATVELFKALGGGWQPQP